ncbi:O-antigen ligase family protein [Paenibacillus sp. JX-17]|uniref:O-antigen ligase family protein n=1 Tax=Paenibacillus lacisoli TaxID=3064525 RepID=A0ABT9CGV8_9BACL|nr:O-antigen ligase family protein [Paenibacillus sp. JX-17]MDO7907823.1 O-antigen ligase family protein [Paenibacillus sp. JX-17]
MLQKEIHWIGALWLVSLAGACLGCGLFFTHHIYISSFSWSISWLMILLLPLLRSWSRSRAGHLMIPSAAYRYTAPSQDKIRGAVHMLEGGPLLLLPLAMAACYTIGFFSVSRNLQASLDELLRWLLYTAAAGIACALARTGTGRRWLHAGWQAAGWLLVLSALFAAYGIVPLPYAVLRSQDPELSAAGARLAGLLQYPNALGAAAAMFGLERLFAAARVWAALPAAGPRLLGAVLPLPPACAVLLLSESRGALLAAGFAAAAGLALQRRGLRGPLLLCAAAPLAGGALIYRQLAEAQLASSGPGLLAAVGLWAAAVLGVLLPAQRLRRRVGRARPAAALLIVAAAAIVAAGAILPVMQDRLAGRISTASARMLMYRDAAELVQASPWLGSGGDTWRTGFHAVQSQPYAGAEVHSGFLDILLDTGAVGLVLVVLCLMGLAGVMWRHAQELLPPLLVWVLHGAVDFDWSYGLFWLLLLNLGAMAYGRRQEERQEVNDYGVTFADEHARACPSADGRVPQRAGERKSTSDAGVSVILPEAADERHAEQAASLVHFTGIFNLLLAGTVMLLSLHGFMSERLMHLASEEGIGENRTALLQQAARWSPYRLDLRIEWSRQLPAPAALEVLSVFRPYVPSQRTLFMELGQLAVKLGHHEEAASYFQQALSLDRYNQHSYDSLLRALAASAEHQLRLGREEAARKTAQAGLKVYETYRQLAEMAGKNSVRNDRRFKVSQEGRQLGEQLVVMVESLTRNHP